MANHFSRLTPMLWTEELEQSISFYVDVLGFTCGEKNDDWGWAALHRDETEIMLAKPNAHSPFQKPVFTGSFYFEVENVDELWNRLQHEAKVVYPIEEFDWGMREFAIYDNNGYMLQFGQEILKNKSDEI